MASKNFKEREVELLQDVKTILEKEHEQNLNKIEERERTGQEPDQTLIDRDKFLSGQIFSKESQIIQGKEELNHEKVTVDNLSKYSEKTGEISNDNEDLELC